MSRFLARWSSSNSRFLLSAASIWHMCESTGKCSGAVPREVARLANPAMDDDRITVRERQLRGQSPKKNFGDEGPPHAIDNQRHMSQARIDARRMLASGLKSTRSGRRRDVRCTWIFAAVAGQELATA
ncbi:hypothetical protein KRP22_008007 [Phytophthora ramorum]